MKICLYPRHYMALRLQKSASSRQCVLRSFERFAQPTVYQTYTAIASLERQLLTGNMQSGDFPDENFDGAVMASDLFEMLPTLLSKGSGFSHPTPDGDDADDFDHLDGDNEPSSWLNDNTISMVEAVLMFLRQLWRIRDAEDFTFACLHLLKTVTGKSATKLFFGVVSKARKMVLDLFNEMPGFIQADDDYVNPFTYFRKLLAKAAEGFNHPLLLKAKQIIWFVLSYSLLEKVGITFDSFWYSEAEKEVIQKQCHSKTDFFKSVFDGLLSLFERLVDCWRTKSWSPLLANERSFGEWSDAVFDLKAKATQLHNPKANGFTYPQFLGDLEDAIEKGRALIKYESGKKSAAGLKRMLAELEFIKSSECTKSAARKSRNAPFSILYYAGSSVAKSTLQDLTHVHFAKTHGLPWTEEFKYTRVAAEDFWSGFMTQMWSIIMDDIAALNPNMGMDPSMGEVLQVRNNASFCPPQADLADKGKTPVLCELLQASTNTKELNANAYYNNPLAILRRWNFIVTAHLKPQYAQKVNGAIPEPDERMLDSATVPPIPEGEYPDLWNFLVEKVVAKYDAVNKRQYPVFEPVLKTESIYEYMAYVSQESTAFRLQQERIRESADTFSRTIICKTCYRPEGVCVCAGEVQSFEFLARIAVGLAAATGMGYAAPKIRKRFVGSATNIGTDVARGVVRNIKLDGLKAIKDYLDAQEYEYTIPEEATVLEPLEPSDPAGLPSEEEVQDEFDTPYTFPDAPEGNWYEEIVYVSKQRTKCAIEQLSIQRQLVGRRIRRIGRKIRGLHFRMSRDPVIACVYGMVLSILSLHVSLGLIKFVLKTAKAATHSMATFASRLLSKKKKKNTPQGSWESGVEALPQDEGENPWYRDDYEPSPLEYGPLTASWKSLPREQVLERVQRNVRHINSFYERDGNQVQRPFRALCLEGQLFVTNNHNVPVGRTNFCITAQRVVSGVNSQVRVQMNEGDFVRFPESDLAFFRISCVPPAASLSGLLVSREFKTVCEGILVSRDEEGEILRLKLAALHAQTEDLEIGEVEGFRGQCEIVTQGGQCGAPYVGFTPMGPAILGLHIMGGISNTVACMRLSKEVVDQAKAVLGYTTVQAGEPNLTDADGNPITLEPIHKKSVFRYMAEGTAEVYGSLPGFRSASKSKVTKTLIHDAMLEQGYEVKVGAPVMRSYVPWRLANQDILQQEFKIDAQILNECVDSFAGDILAALSPEDLGEMVVLGNAATLNGLPGVKYIDKMNRKTSMGFPWRHSKSKELVLFGGHEDWADYVEFKPEFYDRVDDMISKYSEGTRCMPIYTAHLKDEVIALKKVHDKKTRVFAGCPADFAFVMRKYLLASVRVIQKNRFVFECAPGTNATSIEWDGIYHYLVQFGKDRIVAGDYSKFDKRMSATLILAAFRILVILLQEAGWSEEDLTVVRTMAYDVAFPLVDSNGDLVQYFGSNPSGHPLTVIINSLVNSLYVRYAWCTRGNDLKEFKSNVALMTYGDDNIMGISRSVTNFDHTVLQSELAKIGVVYTMADKEAESVPFLNIAATSFLKRAWVFSSEIGSHVAKLEHDSIEKGLLYHIPSKVVCAQQQSVDSMMNALREYFFYGREVFEERRAAFLRVIKEKDLLDYLVEVPHFDTLVEQYIDASKKYSIDGRCEICSA